MRVPKVRTVVLAPIPDVRSGTGPTFRLAYAVIVWPPWRCPRPLAGMFAPPS
jgi:hypothetical protein